MRLQSGLPIGNFDSVTLESAQEAVEFSKQMLARIDALAMEELPAEQWLLEEDLASHVFVGSQRGRGLLA